MRVLLLSDSASEHTEKWAIGLASHGIQIGLFSFNKARYPWYQNYSNIELLYEPNDRITGSALSEKISYLKYLKPLKQKIKEFNPDIVHAHYASSYGFLASLSGFKMIGVSVWGADVYDFPKQNSLFKYLLKYIFSKANFICSTSHCMKKETLLYTNKAITVTPFGIDIDKFNRPETQLTFSNFNEINIGNIKALETKYGVTILIQAFAKVVKHFPNKNIKLFLIGDGSEKDNCKQLAEILGVNDKVIFTGRIPHSNIPEWHRKLDVFVSLSVLNSESFGVSLVEAMSSQSCIVASDVDGFTEVLGEDNSCGIIVRKNSVEAASEALIQLIENPKLALLKAKNARSRAIENYNWQDNIQTMINVYQKVLK
jgi:glycosyltransferase involved in cell wall biosynthesis